MPQIASKTVRTAGRVRRFQQNRLWPNPHPVMMPVAACGRKSRPHVLGSVRQTCSHCPSSSPSSSWNVQKSSCPRRMAFSSAAPLMTAYPCSSRYFSIASVSSGRNFFGSMACMGSGPASSSESRRPPILRAGSLDGSFWMVQLRSRVEKEVKSTGEKEELPSAGEVGPRGWTLKLTALSR